MDFFSFPQKQEEFEWYERNAKVGEYGTLENLFGGYLVTKNFRVCGYVGFNSRITKNFYLNPCNFFHFIKTSEITLGFFLLPKNIYNFSFFLFQEISL